MLLQVFDRLLLLRKGGETVYFGDVGQNATTVIDYFESNGSRKCDTDENPYVGIQPTCLFDFLIPYPFSAEFILDVIGAGATASSERNWHEVWCGSAQAARLQQGLGTIHSEGRNRPLVEASFYSRFATSWLYQVAQLSKHDAEAHWRDPSYLLAKLVLNAVGGLFIGFTFYNSANTQQGTQNKLFVCA